MIGTDTLHHALTVQMQGRGDHLPSLLETPPWIWIKKENETDLVVNAIGHTVKERGNGIEIVAWIVIVRELVMMEQTLPLTRMGFKSVDMPVRGGKKGEALLDVVEVLAVPMAVRMGYQIDQTGDWQRGWGCKGWIIFCYLSS